MQIILKQGGQPVADFSVSGANVTVAGVAIDCAERQQDIAVTVEVRQNIGGPSEGGNGAYLAQIEIPARRYETVIVPAEGEGAAQRSRVEFKYFQRLDGTFSVPAGIVVHSIEARLLQEGQVRARQSVVL